MTRKALNAFDPKKLGVRKARIFETRNPQTGFGEHHYFYRDEDGELFAAVCKGMNDAIRLRDGWREKKKLANKVSDVKLSQIDFVKQQIEKAIAEIEKDDRLPPPVATVFENAPLALIQVGLEQQLRTLKWAKSLLENEGGS